MLASAHANTQISPDPFPYHNRPHPALRAPLSAPFRPQTSRFHRKEVHLTKRQTCNGKVCISSLWMSLSSRITTQCVLKLALISSSSPGEPCQTWLARDLSGRIGKQCVKGPSAESDVSLCEAQALWMDAAKERMRLWVYSAKCKTLMVPSRGPSLQGIENRPSVGDI